MQNIGSDNKNNTSNIQIERLNLRPPGSKHDEAIADLSETIKQNPKDAKPYFCRGMVYSRMVEYAKLVQAFNESLDELDPENAVTHDYKDTVRLLDGYCDAAIKDFTKAIKLGLSNATVYECRGRMHLQRGKCDNAMEYYAKAAELGLGSIETCQDTALPALALGPGVPALGLGPPLSPMPAPAPGTDVPALARGPF